MGIGHGHEHKIGKMDPENFQYTLKFQSFKVS